jgi:glycerate dehydrogenase
MPHSVVFLDRASLQAEVRRPSFAHAWRDYPASAVGELPQKLAQATVAITNKVPLRADTLKQLPKLKMIAVAATGYDVIDIDYCRANGIAVANIRNYAVHTVPEHAFALMLALRRRWTSSVFLTTRSGICSAPHWASSARVHSGRRLPRLPAPLV